MSNRSKKDVFVKEANDTLKRALVSPEFRNCMMEIVTGTKPKNGRCSLEWSLSDKVYLEIEEEHNKKLASYITDLRHGMAAKIRSTSINSVKHETTENKIMNRHRIIIPDDKFDEYWEEKKLLDKDLEKYRRMSYTYNDDKRRIVNDYIYGVENIFQHAYGSPLPIKDYHIEDYEIVLKLYREHQKEYNLAYPSFTEEYLTHRII